MFSKFHLEDVRRFLARDEVTPLEKQFLKASLIRIIPSLVIWIVIGVYWMVFR